MKEEAILTAKLLSLDELSLTIFQEIHVHVSLSVTFSALVEELGPANRHPDGTSMSLTLESWPGGRWFRDLGNGNEHFWEKLLCCARYSPEHGGARPGSDQIGSLLFPEHNKFLQLPTGMDELS